MLVNARVRAVGFHAFLHVLQESTGLGSIDSWTDVLIAPEVNGTVKSVTLALPVTPLQVKLVGGKFTLEWIGNGKLQSADSELGIFDR